MLPRQLHSRAGTSRVVAVLAVLVPTMLVFALRGPADTTPPTRDGSVTLDARIAIDPSGTAGVDTPLPDAATLTGLDALIGRAERMLASGRAAAMRVPEAETGDATSAAAQRATQRWQDWSRAWWNDVQSLQSGLAVASRGVGIDRPEYRFFRDLTEFADRLRTMTTNTSGTTNVPLRRTREERFDRAEAELARVRAAMATLSHER